MFDRLFRRGASAAALCVDVPDDAADRLHDAERRVAQLELLLQQKVVELDAIRALAAKPAAPKPAKAPAKPKAIKPAKLSALEFWAMHGQAVDKIHAEFGDGWKVAAPIGRTELVTLAPGYRSCKTERGVVLRWSRDQRVPSAVYWPNAAFPDGVTVEADYARADPELARLATGPVTPLAHDAAWHVAHGYALHNGVWIAEILLRSQLGHEDGIIADREARRVQALERACLSYGPQPAVAAEPFCDIADELEKLAAD